MLEIIYKIVFSIFTLAVVGRVLFLLIKKTSLLLRKTISFLKNHRPWRPIEPTDSEKNKIWFAEYQRKEREKKELSEKEHYTYKKTYINLSKVQSDRSKLFGERWTAWRFNANNCELVAPGDYHSQCIKIFGEMASARKVLIAKDPIFWTKEKEKFWRKICHPEIARIDLREMTLFNTRQRILAEESFNHGDDPDSHSA